MTHPLRIFLRPAQKVHSFDVANTTVRFSIAKMTVMYTVFLDSGTTEKFQNNKTVCF